VVLGAQIVVMALFGIAAAAFARRAARDHDELLGWFAVGAVLAAFARLNYFLFPSLYTEWFYAGDVLRLGFFAALLIGGLREIRAGEAALAAGAVVEERRRIARELHDGMAQDLAFIVQQGRRIARRQDAPRGMEDIVTAAERALQDSRQAISALMRPTDEPLPAALERAATEVAAREGAGVEIHAGAEFPVPDRTREALVRIVREAAGNAVRHGGARRVTVELGAPPGIHVRIRDDGTGFDTDRPRDPSRFGLPGMRQRAQALGGDLTIRSAPGAGTEILVELP
jgi:signal transduction histidine kinase